MSIETFHLPEVEIIEALGAEEPDDPGYGSNSEAASTSLNSTVLNFIHENGRRYHRFRDGLYLLPNDDLEQARERLNDAMFLKLFAGTIQFAPLQRDKALNVIDLGTGTGTWATAFADFYPLSSVLGIDLSPIQSNWVPPNLKFMVDDAESEWVSPLNHFHYIHTRHMIHALRDWPQLLGRSIRHLKPGGWIECQEIDHIPHCDDGTLTKDNPMALYWTHIHSAFGQVGVQSSNAPHLASMMRRVGFINVTERISFVPIGPWSENRHHREIGWYWRKVLMEGLEAIALRAFTKVLGWRREEIEVFLAGVRKAYMDPAIHAFMLFYTVCGQKPALEGTEG
ncbi:S-adenosyl-L-methionine-dependent methyltransferase [Phaeosphaeriaceae sp. PMI808]|nr:S-adenosyl-L-methionine-dependent methyltransferase [Phaeosphaeriaceae sp. PMI808]